MAWPLQGLFAVALLSAHLAKSQAIPQRRKPTVSVPACSGKTVAVLELADVANRAGLPACNVDADFMVCACLSSCAGVWLLLQTEAWKLAQVNPENGVVYSAKASSTNLRTHRLGTHAAPWFLGKAIRSSVHYTGDWEKADIVFVDGGDCVSGPTGWQLLHLSLSSKTDRVLSSQTTVYIPSG